MLVFPTRLFNPTSLRVRPIGAAASGGRSMAGIEQLGALSGGGLWSITFGEVNLWAREKFMAWRALEAALDSGATPILVPLGDRRHAPVTSPPVSLAFDDDALWDDGSGWTASEVTATTTADAALRATSLTFAFAGPVDLVGGEFLSVLHAGGLGWRLYQIVRLTDNGGGSYTAVIRTPLRAAVASGTPLNFEAPRCVCRLDGDPGTVLDMLRFGAGGPVSFVETFPSLATA
jgi:hypothetical protein